ncbi:uncharacterized protein [Littorina saxatilis]|uniref:uncharacterized protein n=1 Tax=Littorina saxatilis TaxID=31220 RepID=UPI0038B56C8C
MDVSYLTLLLFIAHLCVHPAVSSCKGQIEYPNLTGTELTAVENSRLILEVRIPCENPVNKVTVTLGKQVSSGLIQDSCRIRQENGSCSSTDQNACRCVDPNSSPGLYHFERTARLSDTAKWRVRTLGDVKITSFINFVIHEASTTTARMTETRESDGQSEKPSSAPGIASIN